MNIIEKYSQGKTTSLKRTENINTNKNTDSKVKLEYKPDVLDILSEKVINKRDINDMVTVPRSIFKGYLAFTTGTIFNTIGEMVKYTKASKPLNIIGCLFSIYGTFNFVKPFLIKGKQSE